MAKRKRILICIDWFLPGTQAGGPIRSVANMIDHLDIGFEFLIITTNSDYNSNQAYQSVDPDTWIEYNSYTSVYYFSKNSLRLKNLKNLIEVTQHDYLYLNGIYSLYFSILPLFISKQQKIIAPRGMLSMQAFSQKGLKKRIVIKCMNLLGGFKGSVFQVNSLRESEDIKVLLGKNTQTKVISNLPRKINPLQRIKKITTKRECKRFIYLARISPEKGQHYFLEALMNITEPLLLDLYGAINDKSYWRNCQKIIEVLPKNIKVQYKGVLESHDVPTQIIEYDYLVLTSEGENYGHSIVEAMVSGVPVIISNCTPWVNLEKHRVGWDINVKDSQGLSRTINFALSLSKERYNEISNNCRKYILENKVIMDAFKGYNQLFN